MNRTLVGLVLVTLIKVAVSLYVGWTVSVNEIAGQARAFETGADVFDPRRTGNNAAFFPAGNYVLAGACAAVARAVHQPISVVVKWPAIAGDLVIALVLQQRWGARPAWLYMLSPLSLVLSVYHGQFHTPALAATVAALHLGSARARPGRGPRACPRGERAPALRHGPHAPPACARAPARRCSSASCS